MRTLRLLVTLLLVSLFTACSTTTYTRWQGNTIYKGEGGTIQTVKGIDIWENGAPDRPYQIIGLIDRTEVTSGIRGIINAANHYNTLAETAKQYGGEAIILHASASSIGPLHIQGNADGSIHSYQTASFAGKYLVVKYVNPN